jgi:hypothetical protein
LNPVHFVSPCSLRTDTVQATIPDDKLIRDEDIELGVKLGEGSYGAVYEALYNGAPYVLKVGLGA